jgi:hypothetical protein
MRLYGVSDDERRARLAQLVHESREQGCWERYTDGVHAERFFMNAPARCTALETEAVRVRSFEVSWVHGLLQVPDYTRAVLARCWRIARPTRWTGSSSCAGAVRKR